MSEYNKILNRDSSVSNLDSKDCPDDLDSISLSNQDNQGRNHDNQGRKSSNQANQDKIKVQTFKQTEIGLIPEDWEVKAQKEIVKYINGRAFGLNEWEKSGVPVVRLQNLTNKGGNFYYSNLPLPDYQYMYKNDLIFMWSASFGPYIWWGDKAIFHYHIWKIECKNNQADKDFYYFKLLEITEELKKGTSGSTMLHLTKGFMEKYLVSVPPLPEQKAIAQVLSDTDALIQTLEQKLAKKRAVKQGAMQQLLTPKEGWVVRRLGNIGKTFGGLSGKSKPDFSNGNSKYIPFMNIMSNPVIDTTYLDSVFIKKNESQNKAIKGDLFFNGSSETPEEVGLCSVLLENIPNLYLNSFCFGFRLFNQEEFNGLYLSYFFRSDEGRKLFYSLAQGATRYNLSKANFLKLEFSIPNPKEQTRIASILSDMDVEIAQLEQKLDKYKLLKQGLMQELLTGRIRLV